LTDEWIMKMWRVYLEGYSATRKKEITSFAGKCLELNSKRQILHVLAHVGSRSRKTALII
jgi:hypothetical protein